MKTINTITFLLSFLASIYLTAQGEPLPHTVDFNDPATLSWTNTAWVIAGGVATSDGQGTDSYLVSPVFDFSGLTELPTITVDFENDQLGGFILEIIIDSGSPIEIWYGEVTTTVGTDIIVDGDYQAALSTRFRSCS